MEDMSVDVFLIYSGAGLGVGLIVGLVRSLILSCRNYIFRYVKSTLGQ